MRGALMAENASMKIDYLQTKYKINDTIRFDKAGIRFRNIKLTDEKGNNAVLSGTIFHKSFKDYSIDLLVNMDKNPCLVLNTQQRITNCFTDSLCHRCNDDQKRPNSFRLIYLQKPEREHDFLFLLIQVCRLLNTHLYHS